MSNFGQSIILFSLFPLLLNLVLVILGIVFFIKVMKFMDTKIKLDQERNEKLSNLINQLNKEK